MILTKNPLDDSKSQTVVYKKDLFFKFSVPCSLSLLRVVYVRKCTVLSYSSVLQTTTHKDISL